MQRFVARSYDTAKRGTLRLLPAEKNIADLKADLTSMRKMFFDEPPAFEAVITTLQDWEYSFNAKDSPTSSFIISVQRLDLLPRRNHVGEFSFSPPSDG